MSTSVEPSQAASVPDDGDLPRSPRWRGALAGVLVGGLALGVAELFAGMFSSVPSLVTAVGQAFIPNTPAWLKDFAVEVFGTSDKLVLNAGVTMVTLAVAAVAGVLAFRSPAAAAPVLGGLALIGGLAAVQDTFANPVLVLVALVVSIGGGYAALAALASAERDWRAARAGVHDGTGADDQRRQASITAMARRRFLALTSGVGVAGIATALGGRSLTLARQARFDEMATGFSLPSPIRPAQPVGAEHTVDVDGITPIVEQAGDFYRIDTALVVPRVDPSTWSLKVTGMVDREIELSYDDLLSRDMVEAYVTLSCVSNEVGGGLVGNALWLGYPLRLLLEEAGVATGAEQVVGRSVDGFTVGFPIDIARDDRDALVAVGMNGEPLPPQHGYPARLVVPGLYGYVSATKWLSEIELTTWDGFDAYWVPRGWAKEAPVKTQSRIDVPRPNTQVPVGPTVFGGIAWAPHRGISRVEVRAEDGDWVEAELSSPLSDDAWVQWRAELDVPEGWTLFEVRATDGTGMTQGEDYVPPRPDGAEGYHVIRVRGV